MLDRFIQQALLQVLQPVWDRTFSDRSYGFRPGRSAQQAVAQAQRYLGMGCSWVVDLDLEKFFETIPHAKLMTMVAERICDGALLHLIQMWLKAPVMEVDKDGTKRNIGGGKGNRKGTPQGGVISPLLSNLFLHLLDRLWEKRGLQQRLGARIVRYADDIVVLCRQGTGEPMAVLRQILERMGLTLNEAKTQVVKAYRGKFSFLGFEIWMAKSRRTGSWYPHVQPSRKSLKTIKDRITQLTARTRTAVPMDWLVNELNAAVRGWVGYFHVRNCSQSLARVRWHLEERMRTHLRKRHKIRDRRRGFSRFANRDLYGKYGLYKVPTTAGCTKAQASR